MAPQGLQLGPKGLPGGACFGLQKSTTPNGFSTSRGLEASQANTKPQDQQEERQEGPRVLRVDRCHPGIGARVPKVVPKWRPSRPLVVAKGYNTDGHLMICELAASEGGTTRQDQHEAQKDGQKGPMPHFDPRTLGLLWAQEAPKLAPGGAQADPLWS